LQKVETGRYKEGRNRERKKKIGETEGHKKNGEKRVF